jgi:SAM-dependent methyltransferase
MAEYLRHCCLMPERGRLLEIGGGNVSAYRLLFASAVRSYLSIDLWPGLGDVTGDVVDTPFQDATFDVVVCSHVLEHVSDDFRALAEIRRILTPRGLALFQVPFDDRRYETVEGNGQPSQRLGTGYFHGHAREYGLDVVERLRFFWPATHEAQPLLVTGRPAAAKHGFDRNYGTIFVCYNHLDGQRPAGQLRRRLAPLKRQWMIRSRAYELFEERARAGALDDWLVAEQQVAAVTDDQLEDANVFRLLGRATRDRVCDASQPACTRTEWEDQR